MSDSFELPSELNIYSAQETRDALLAWVAACTAKAQPVVVCASQVREVDGAGLQLIAALGASEPHWSLVQPSEAFAQACSTIGLAHWLDGAAAMQGA